MKTPHLAVAVAVLSFGLPGLAAASRISFSAASHTVSEAAPHVAILVLRTADLEPWVSVDLATTNVTATPGSDYADVKTTVTFAAGETARTVLVPIWNDGVREPSETFRATLANPTGGAVLGTRMTTITIADNDSGLAFESAAYVAYEEDPSLAVAVLRGDDNDFPITVEVWTVDVGAEAGLDYSGLTNTLTFVGGERRKLVAVPIVNDTQKETDEGFRLILSHPTGGGMLGVPNTTLVTLRDNDQGLAFEFAEYVASEQEGSVLIAVLRGDDGDDSITVDVQTLDATALAGLDYAGVHNTVSFVGSERRKVVAVPLVKDTLKEPNEAFRLVLRNPIGGAPLGAPASTIVTLRDSDPGLAFEFSNYWGREEEGSVLIGVLRRDDQDIPITVEVQTLDGTAKAGLDYTGVTNTLSFAAGKSLKLFTVPILNDGLAEAEETFGLVLGHPTGGGMLGAARICTVAIADNDPGVGFTEARGRWMRLQDGGVALSVVRGNDVNREAFTVEYATDDDTALAGRDYIQSQGTLAFAAGELQQTIYIPFLDDGVGRPDRQFTVRLSNPTGGLGLGTVTNTVTICDMREMMPRRLAPPNLSADGAASVELRGGYTPALGVVKRFSQFFEVYPVEASSDLVHWESLGWFVRTNSLAGALTIVADGTTRAQRFYRVPPEPYVAPQLPPTGPYPVGVVRRELHDPTRRNRYRESANCRFMITVWYPAERRAGAVPDLWVDASTGRETRDAWTPAEDRVPYVHSYSALDASFAEGLTACPIVLWSHGYLNYHEDGVELAELWASHGYVVVGIGHHDESVTLFADGTYRYFPVNDLRGRELSEAGLQDRVRDFRVVVEALAQWNREAGLFHGRLDVEQVAAAGYSWGGTAAAEYCRVEDRCRGVVSVDGGGASGLLTYGLQKPSLAVNNPGFDSTVLITKARKNAVAFKIADTTHDTFWTGYWMVPGNASQLQKDHEAHQIMRDYSLWFLNRLFKGSTDPLPDPKQRPRIVEFQQK